MSVAPGLRATKPLEIKPRGFSLIEIAMVLMIAGLVLGAGLRALGPQLEQRRYSQTQEQLQVVSEALYGFFVLNQRLPCPASTTSNGREWFCTALIGVCNPTNVPQDHGRCVNPNNGFLPAATLGLPGAGQVGDTYPGLLPDAWGFPVRYAVSHNTAASLSGHYPFTAANAGVRGVYQSGNLDQLESTLRVCSTSAGATAADCATPTQELAQPTFLLWSTGRRGPNLPAAGDDETKNRTNDPVFVSRPRDEAFDHLIFWQSQPQFFGRISAQLN